MNQKSSIISDQNLSHSPGLQMLVPEHTRSQYAELARQHLGPTQEKNPQAEPDIQRNRLNVKEDRYQNLAGMLQMGILIIT